jgi:predicted regulator of Ras-like GTPase activity (Roadblock/LC7/MglB family)
MSAVLTFPHRHAELVSASMERMGTRAEWTLKQVQGDEIRQITVELKS